MAFSAITIRGETNLATSAASVAITPTGTLAVGQLAVAVFSTASLSATDGSTSNHSTVTDTSGNTWQKAGEYSQSNASATDGSTVSVWWTTVRTQLTTGSTVTMNLSGGSVAERCGGLLEVTASGGFGAKLQVAAVGQNTLTASTGAITNREYLLVYVSASVVSDAAKTAGTNYNEQFDNRSRNNAAAVSWHCCTRIATLTSDSTASTAFTLGTNSTISMLVALYEAASSPSPSQSPSASVSPSVSPSVSLSPSPSSSVSSSASPSPAPPATHINGYQSTPGGSGVSSIGVNVGTTTAGELVVVSLGWYNQTFTSIADTYGNTWSQVGTELGLGGGSSQFFRQYYSIITNGGTNTVVTLTVGGTGSFPTIVADRFGGSGWVLDQTASVVPGPPSATSLTTGATGTRAQADEVMVGGMSTGHTGATTVSAGTNVAWALGGVQQDGTNGVVVAQEYFIPTAVGTQGAEFSWTGGQNGYAGRIATFTYTVNAGSSSVSPSASVSPSVSPSISKSPSASPSPSAAPPMPPSFVAKPRFYTIRRMR